MRLNLKKNISRIFILILLISFVALPLNVSICLINHDSEEHRGEISEVSGSKNIKAGYNCLKFTTNDKCCEDSGTLYFYLDNHREIKNSVNPFSNVLSTVDSNSNFLSEKKHILEFFAHHFSPPQNNSNKLYKITSSYLI